MIKTSCHCGRVEVQIPELPERLTSCNCSICHRIGALWAYYTLDTVTISAETELLNYVQGDRTLTLHSCGHCGCTTHYVATDGKPDARVAVNMRMAPRKALEDIPVRRFDGADTWKWLD